MTNHYNIEIVITQTFLKATYRDGKFRKLEHLRGALDDGMMRQIGRIIPRKEIDINAFSETHRGKVRYNAIITEKSLFTLFNDEWHTFYENFSGLPPKFTGADGKSLNAIISHLKHIGNSETEALALWQIILQKWDTLNDFHKQNTDLKYINSKLNIIIHAIKQQSNTFTSGADGSVEL